MYQRSQMPYPHYNYPTFHIPSQMGVHPHPLTHFPAPNCEPWSCGGGNYGYRIPDSYNYYFPPYPCSGYSHPYHPPPPPVPCFHHSCCPPTFNNMHHPVPYAPPPNYSMEIPTYDYDKKPDGRCPHHLCCRGGDTKGKEPDAEKRTDSFPPALSKNLPYPIVWIPPEEVNPPKQMLAGFTEPGVVNSSDQPRDSFKLENEKRVENQQSMDGTRYPFPILWIPYKSKEAEKKDQNEEQTTPTLITGHDQEVGSLKPSKESADSNLAQATTMVGKNDLSHCKSIPVKQLDEPGDHHTVSKQPENELAKNNPEGGHKRSKLPPVCLRIEPIPKKKNGSGKSRSLSPPKRGKPEELVTESSATKGSKEDMKSAGEPEHCKLAQIADPKINQAEIPCSGKEVGHSEAMDSKDQSMDNQVVEVVKRKELTEAEAALIIQAVYRGYEVRKWEPIKKLKEIGKVKEELNEVRNRMKAMEFSSYSSSDKERSLLGEMIMNLLLKLDTIQGLDPFTRDVRKSTAKELVNLQEQVDSVVNNKREDVNSSQLETETTDSEDVKVCGDKIGATKEEEKEVIAIEETAKDDDGGVIDLEATKKEEEESTKKEEEESTKKEEEEGKEEATSPQMEMKTTASDEIKVCEDVVEATKEEEEMKTTASEEIKVCEGVIEATKEEEQGKEATSPQMEMRTIDSEEAKGCAEEIEATEKEEEEKDVEEGLIALEEAAPGANGGTTDAEATKEGEEEEKEAVIALEEFARTADNRGETNDEATKKEEEEKEVTALEEAAESAESVGVTDHVAAKEEEEEDVQSIANEGWATSTTIANSGEMLELKEEKGSDLETKHALMGEADNNGASEDTTRSGLEAWGEEERDDVALMKDADNGGASDEGLGHDTGIITSTINSGSKTELKEEEEGEEEKMRMTMEKLVEKGKEQLEVIRELSERVIMLEKKLATANKKKKAWARTRTKTGTRKCNLK